MTAIELCVDESRALGVTLLSNAFIDNYMKDANDVQLKVYLRLLRNVSVNAPTDVAALADLFNYSEKDVLRALQYWERRGLLRLVYDSSAMQRVSGDDYSHYTECLTAIRLVPPGSAAAMGSATMGCASEMRGAAAMGGTATMGGAAAMGSTATMSDAMTGIASEMAGAAESAPLPGATSATPAETTEPLTGTITATPAETAEPLTGAITATPAETAEPRRRGTPVSEIDAARIKAGYTLDDMRSFRQDPDYGTLFTAAQMYLGRPLSEPQLRTLLFLTRELHFPAQVSDYLLQYCIGSGHSSFHYIEATGLSWAEQGIDSLEAARALTHGRSHAPSRDDTQADRGDATIRHILQLLGRSGEAAPQEAALIHRWLHTYALPMPLIEEACGRAVLATQTGRFPYVEAILKSWHANGASTLDDIAALDRQFQESRQHGAATTTAHTLTDASSSTPSRRAPRASRSAFCSIATSSTDYAALEQQLSAPRGT